MDDTTANLMDIRVPGDDGEISRTLADLESKLEAWTAAVAEVHSALAQRVASEPPASVQPEAQAAEPVELAPESRDEVHEPITPPEPDATVSEAIEPPDEPVKEVDVVEVPKESSACETPDTAIPTAASKDLLGRPVSDVRPAGEEIPDTQESRASASQEEAEALLNSLDPEMARAIHVMRRVSPVKRTIRELIEEYEATHSSRKAASSSQKKSWWARG